MYTSNLPIIFLLLLVGHRTISNTLELDTAQDMEKKTRENRTVGKMLALLKNAVRTLLEKCRFTPFKKTFVIRIPRVAMNKLPMV